MIIYAAQPNRFYPYFFKKFFDCNPAKYRPCGKTVDLFYKESPEKWYSMSLFTGSYQTLESVCQYHRSYNDVINDKELMYHENGKNYIYFDEEFRSKTDMVLGIMNTERIYKQKDDFIISTIIHPIDRVYELCFFINALKSGVALPLLHKNIIQFYVKQLNLHEDDDNSATLETFIDAYIETKGAFSIIDNVQIDENSYKQTNIIGGNNDFVGFMSDPVSILRTTVYLNNKFGTKIDHNELFVFYKKIQQFCAANTYRRSELEKLLADDVEHFYGLRKQYMGF